VIDFEQVKSESIGRWPSILASLGIDAGRGEHRACPRCGGKDRFRFDDKGGRGTWFCNQCGAGDGVKLVKLVFNVDFIEAMRKIEGVVGVNDHHPPIIRKNRDEKKIQGRLRRLWDESTLLTGSDLVSKYLRGRGLFMAVKDVRFCPKCFEPDSRRTMPAMVAAVRNVEGKPVSIHRTYLAGPAKASIKSPKKLMPGVEPLAGCAIQLFDAVDHVGVAEGIETAIAACQLFGVPTWATISSTILESFRPPEKIRRVVIFGDSDPNHTGQAAAHKLAKRLYRDGFNVEVNLPERGDWADILAETQINGNQKAGSN
jgi:putative DNA primase/helicase